MKICVVSPKCSHVSAGRLADLLGAAYARAGECTGDFTNYDAVINYGSSMQYHYPNKLINNPTAVSICVNKISTLKRVDHGIEWTKDKEKALKWIHEDGYVVCRETETGNRSKGITIADTDELFNNTPAKFWTRYFFHEHEVRINVFKDKILTVYEKCIDEADNTFVFNLMPIEGEHNQVNEMISSIRRNIGIDYYGLDVLVNDKGVARLLEINTGPILLEETEEILLKAIKKELRT